MTGESLLKKFHLSYSEKYPSETILKMCPSKHDAIYPYEAVIKLELKKKLQFSHKGPPFQLAPKPKGQLISKCLYEIIVWTKIPTKNLISALKGPGQKLSNFSLVFWSKR